jgi:glycosyltransferase involved in cell wall biosynthesis
MLELFVVVNCGPCAPFIGRCLASLLSQTYRNWHAMVTVDPCGDRTYDAAVEAARADRRINITRNSTRLYALENLVRAIRQTPLDPEAVIVILDGDDWLNVDHSLATLTEAYDQHACWLTYGSWVTDFVERPRGRWPAYPADTENFRAAPWLATHLRSWKKWLWDLVNDDDLRDDEGQYFRVAVDMAVMIPMLEICGIERIRHIDEPIYFLNRRYDSRTDESRHREQERNDLMIRSRSPYARRNARPS